MRSIINHKHININIITLFPGFFDSPLKTGVLGRAVRAGFLHIRFVNLRDFTDDKHQSVDDTPFGGGDGMVMKYKPLQKAMEFLSQKEDAPPAQTIYLSPQGKKWDYARARAWATRGGTFTFVCGRYGGVDQRFINQYVDEEISVGDYVLTGGEPALLVILDSVCRFIKGALGNDSSARAESFENAGLLEAPQWTRPREIKGCKIPEVILSGHHKNIERFRFLLSLAVTAIKRPDLLKEGADVKALPEALQVLRSLTAEELKACGLTPQQLSLLEQKTKA